MLMIIASPAVQKDDFCVLVGPACGDWAGSLHPGTGGPGSAGSAEPWVGGWAPGAPAGRTSRCAPGRAGSLERKGPRGAEENSGGIPYGCGNTLAAGGHLAALESRRDGLRGRVAGRLGRAREGGRGRRDTPPGWAPGLPGRVQAAGICGRWDHRSPPEGRACIPSPAPHSGWGPEPCLPARPFYFWWGCSHRLWV